jgi:uncharacterized protein YuzE
MIQKFKFDYDYENDSLFVYDSKSKTKASVEIDDLIIDYNSKKQISAIELLNASKFFRELSSKNVKLTKKKLNELLDCKIEILPKNGFFMIKFIFTFKSRENLVAPVMVPTIHESSPAVLA